MEQAARRHRPSPQARAPVNLGVELFALKLKAEHARQALEEFEDTPTGNQAVFAAFNRRSAIEKISNSRLARLDWPPLRGSAIAGLQRPLGSWRETDSFRQPRELRSGEQLYVISLELGKELPQSIEGGRVRMADGDGRPLFFQHAAELPKLPQRVCCRLRIIKEDGAIECR